MDTKQELDTKQHCSNYQNHKHGEESGPAITGSYNYVFALKPKVIAIGGGRVGHRDGPG